MVKMFGEKQAHLTKEQKQMVFGGGMPQRFSGYIKSGLNQPGGSAQCLSSILFLHQPCNLRARDSIASDKGARPDLAVDPSASLQQQRRNSALISLRGLGKVSASVPKTVEAHSRVVE